MHLTRGLEWRYHSATVEMHFYRSSFSAGWTQWQSCLWLPCGQGLAAVCPGTASWNIWMSTKSMRQYNFRKCFTRNQAENYLNVIYVKLPHDGTEDLHFWCSPTDTLIFLLGCIQMDLASLNTGTYLPHSAQPSPSCTIGMCRRDKRPNFYSEGWCVHPAPQNNPPAKLVKPFNTTSGIELLKITAFLTSYG